MPIVWIKKCPYYEYAKLHWNLTLKRRNTFLAKLVDLSTFWAVPGSPLLTNFEPYCIALHILSLASALFKYKTARASSALAASKALILLYKYCKIRIAQGQYNKEIEYVIGRQDTALIWYALSISQKQTNFFSHTKPFYVCCKET